LCLCLSICRQIRKNLCDCCHATTFFLRRCPCQRPATRQSTAKRRGKYRLIKTAATGLTALISRGPLVTAVNPDTLVLTARSEECYHNSSNNWCVWNHVSSATIKPGLHGLQLLMRNNRNITLGTVTVTATQTRLVCASKTVKWSYAYTVKTYSEKRCPGLGNCTGNSCTAWPTDVAVPELQQRLAGQVSGAANHFCMESCRTWTCGCPVPPHIPNKRQATTGPLMSPPCRA
jgi:hypothetical protein